MRVVFVQNGDFRASHQRIQDGMGETFHAQIYSMRLVETLAAQEPLAAVISFGSQDLHDEVLPTGVRSIGLKVDWTQRNPFKAVAEKLDELAPTHLILRTPSTDLLSWARQKDLRVLPSFADSFTPRPGLRGWLDRLRARRLAKALNHPSIQYVGNHNIAAAEDLARIGVAPEKIIPWDWPRAPTPSDYPAKPPSQAAVKRLIFVGSVSEAKGVGDILRAMAADPNMGNGATLDVLGAGEIDAMRSLASELGVDSRVRFHGRVPFAEVAPSMRAADAVLVYSRHAYTEGLPGTIYLGFASRTPVVVSDHPMFVGYFDDGTDLLIVPERAPEALAAKLRELFDDQDLYRSLSENSQAAFDKIAHPVHWGEFIERWLRQAPEDLLWLDRQTLPAWR